MSGTINLFSPLNVKSDMTIAGETAPGSGITIYGGNMTSPNDLVKIHNVSDVIVRFIRFRSKDFNRASVTTPMNADSLSIHNSDNVIVDHCSMSWGNDGSIDVSDSFAVTVQWSIISETLLPHSRGMLTYGNLQIGTMSVHHNLFISNDERSCQITGNAGPGPDDRVTDVEFVNNVVCNWNNLGTAVRDSARAHVIRNYYKPSPTTNKKNQATILYTTADDAFYEGNLFTGGSDRRWDKNPSVNFVVIPYNFAPASTEPASTAYSKVVGNDPTTLAAGASLVLDVTDDRLLREARGEAGWVPSLKDSIPVGEEP